MRKITLIALVAALLISVAACHKDKKTQQLAALDEAYKSGVLTREEYDARKQAVLAQPNAPGAPAPPAAPAQPDAAGAPSPEQMQAAPTPFGAMPSAPASSAAAPPTPEQMPAAPAPSGAIPSAPASSAAPPPPPAGHVPRSPAPAPAPPVQPPVSSRSNGADREEPEPAPLAGCEDAESKGGGAKGVQVRFFPAPVEAVRRAASLALKNLDFTIHVDAAHQMEASKRRRLSALVGGGGERLFLRFESAQRSGQSGTRVTGETRKSIVGILAQKSWTSAVLAQIACNLRTGRY
jgi:hypothetical protein